MRYSHPIPVIVTIRLMTEHCMRLFTRKSSIELEVGRTCPYFYGIGKRIFYCQCQSTVWKLD